MITKKLNEWQAQWTKTLTEYNFVIQHCKRKDNSWADILSRRSDFIKKAEEKQEQTMLQENQNEQLEYAHCRITWIKKSLNKQIRKKTAQDRFTKKNSQWNQWTSQNESHEETVIVSRTSIHVICNKKRNDLTTS